MPNHYVIAIAALEQWMMNASMDRFNRSFIIEVESVGNTLIIEENRSNGRNALW